MDNKVICSIIVDQIGFISSYADSTLGIMASKFEWYDMNGEMGRVRWIRQTFEDGVVKEYNGKYIIEVSYEPEPK